MEEVQFATHVEYHHWLKKSKPTGYFNVTIKKDNPKLCQIEEVRLQNGEYHSLETYACKVVYPPSKKYIYFCIYGRSILFSEWILRCNRSKEDKAMMVLKYG